MTLMVGSFSCARRMQRSCGTVQENALHGLQTPQQCSVSKHPASSVNTTLVYRNSPGNSTRSELLTIGLPETREHATQRNSEAHHPLRRTGSPSDQHPP